MEREKDQRAVVILGVGQDCRAENDKSDVN